MRKLGVDDLHALKKSLSTKEKIHHIADQTMIPVDYLIIMKRELGSLDVKKVDWKDFPTVDEQVAISLHGQGIKDTKDFFDSYNAHEDELKFSGELGLDPEEARRLYSLSSLVRINGVAALAAVVFYEAGYRNIKDILDSSVEEMTERFNRSNGETGRYNGTIGLKDMQFVMDFVRLMDRLDS